MNRILISIFTLLFSLHVWATAQAPDYLIYEGDRLPLHVNPLEKLFFEKKELRPETEVISSGNWRGYIATFEVTNNSISVSDITIRKPDPDKEHSYLKISVIDKVFPTEKQRKMNWFSGLLVIPKGERTGYVHLSYASQYEKYLLLRVKDGSISESAEMNLDEYMKYKQRQFSKYKKTTEYKIQIEELRKDSETGDDFDLEGFMFQMGGFTQTINIPFAQPNAALQRTSRCNAALGQYNTERFYYEKIFCNNYLSFILCS